MKKLALALALAFVAASAYAAQEPAAKTAHPAHKVALKTHPVNAEFVSASLADKTLTVKTDTGETTVPLEGKALAEVKNIKAGEKVIVTCRDDAQGNHQAAVAIKAAPVAKRK